MITWSRTPREHPPRSRWTRPAKSRRVFCEVGEVGLIASRDPVK